MRGAAALFPFVQRWGLSLNPEDLDEMAYAVLRNYDRKDRDSRVYDAIERDVNAQLDRFTRLNVFGRPMV